MSYSCDRLRIWRIYFSSCHFLFFKKKEFSITWQNECDSICMSFRFKSISDSLPLRVDNNVPKMTQIQYNNRVWIMSIENVAHQCEKSYDSWTPSGVLYFLVIKSSWSLLGTSSKYDSGRLEQYMKNLRNFHKKYAFRPEIYLELFQVQIRTTLY